MNGIHEVHVPINPDDADDTGALQAALDIGQLRAEVEEPRLLGQCPDGTRLQYEPATGTALVVWWHIP